MKRSLASLMFLLLSACQPSPHEAHQPAPPSAAVTVAGPWLRATPPGAPVAGGFLTLHNGTAADDRLLAVESAAAQRVEIHEMREQGGVARMRELIDGLPLPAGATAELKPGGYHLMFIQPTRALPAGGQVDATLVFERAGRMPVVFEVRPLGAAEAKPHP